MAEEIVIDDKATPEVEELRDTAAEWQKQFHTLQSAIEKEGFEVFYDDNGSPAVKLLGKSQ